MRTTENNLQCELQHIVPPFRLAEQEDPVVWAKLVAPWAPFTWHIIEFKGEDDCYGVVTWFGRRLIRFSLRRVLALRGPNDERVIRDPRFAPCQLSDLE